MTLPELSISRRTAILIALGIGVVVLVWTLRRRRVARSLAWRVPETEPRLLYPPAPPPEPVTDPVAPPRTRFRRQRVIGVALVLVALLALAAVWWFDSDVTPKEPTLATSTPVPQSILYVVDAEQSSLGVKVKSRIGTVSGVFDVEQGVVELVPTGEGQRIIANIRIDGASLDVGNGLINATLRRALELEEYPTGVYTAESQDTIPAQDGTYEVVLNGRVELRGVQQEVAVDSTVTLTGDQITLTALMPIDVTAFGVSVPSLLASNVLETDLLIVGARGDARPAMPENAPGD